VGKHVFGNLYDCCSPVAKNEGLLRKVVLKAVELASMNLVELRSWSFGGKKGGISIIALIQESHIAVHTWTQYNYSTVDVYTCGEDSKASAAFDYIASQLQPLRITKHVVDRSSDSVP